MAFIPAVKSKVWSERVRYSFPILHKGTCIVFVNSSSGAKHVIYRVYAFALQHGLHRLCVPLCSMG